MANPGAYGSLKPLELPSAGGPWSWRSFNDRHAAYAFFERVADGDPEPWQLDEPRAAPDGRVLAAGTWVVIYHPIIFGPHRNGDRGSVNGQATS
jgi:hypothetical protein